MPSSITQRFESILNRIIRDSGALRHARALEGRIIVVTVKGLDLSAYASVQEGLVTVLDDVPDEPDVRISGTPIGLLKLLRVGADPAVLRDGTVRIEGDGSAMLELKALLGALDIDGEEELSQIVGDTLARKLANGARGFAAWASDVADSSLLGIAETLVEESRVLPSRPRTERFVDSVDRLRDDVARLEQRVARLADKAKG